MTNHTGDRSGIFDLRVALRALGPAVAWTLFNIAAAGDLFSARHTGTFLAWFFQTFFPNAPSHWFDVTHTLLRKGAHFFNYAMLSWLWFRAARYWELRERSRAWQLRWALWGLAFAIATAVGDETLQHFVPSRTGTATDVVLDGCGALFAQFVIAGVWRARERAARSQARSRTTA
ncbi:MAG: VanZ family protein [Acidobacteriota bacterium]|nr:VanZ family protein [Acidobacteriota bacterium]